MISVLFKRVVLLGLCSFKLVTAQQAKSSHPVQALKVTVLSTMLADAGIGEWGFAALVEIDGRRLLFDTGARPNTVLQNAVELKIDLSSVTDVIISHNHYDHVGGLLTLRRELSKKEPAAMIRTHVGEGIFSSRPRGTDETNSMIDIKAEYTKLNGEFIQYTKPTEIFPGVWLTGPIPRKFPERNWSSLGKVKTEAGLVEDTVPEDQALVIDTDKGLVVMSGCGHAGIINTIDYARSFIRPSPIFALLGGLHLFNANDQTLQWTGEKLKEAGLANLLGGHCTGIEAVYRLRELTGLDRKTAVVSAVGSSFSIDKGIDPLNLAK
jgi:7,8-dihydropterin-6-yl-methyl-4-(beta-D-ribofuranosyl)aminobenzene 5'-phosphate synthase